MKTAWMIAVLLFVVAIAGADGVKTPKAPQPPGAYRKATVTAPRPTVIRRTAQARKLPPPQARPRPVRPATAGHVIVGAPYTRPTSRNGSGHVVGNSVEDCRIAGQLAIERQRQQYELTRQSADLRARRDREWAATWRQENHDEWAYGDRRDARVMEYGDRQNARAAAAGRQAMSYAHQDFQTAIQYGVVTPTPEAQKVFFRSREAAMEAFRSNYLGVYRNEFAEPPACWPEWIPRVTEYNGAEVNLSYDITHHCYGLWDGPEWVTYDLWQDQSQLDWWMRTHHRYAW